MYSARNSSHPFLKAVSFYGRLVFLVSSSDFFLSAHALILDLLTFFLGRPPLDLALPEARFAVREATMEERVNMGSAGVSCKL